MVLIVKVYVNNRQIAEAEAVNVSNLESLSDYECRVRESQSEFVPGSLSSFRLEAHPRRQSCWALVKKLAEGAL